ncbi:hypothetical protein PR202_gb29249 [Eleusine coracana subsp. coracana]|uniref:Uncharacterized protein n=1 Tax=Eleusine coracana subsp. coracana TaxID=191504 RepID=A0AAV5G0U7_ELECO|nr:hypothetical protein PR202_gb29249 [Eleusine coracana subsp. coracana]
MKTEGRRLLPDKNKLDFNLLCQEVSAENQEIDPILDLVVAKAPPKGPVSMCLEELIQITAQKRVKPKRKVEVTGRRMEKFVPPSQSQKRKSERGDLFLPQSPELQGDQEGTSENSESQIGEILGNKIPVVGGKQLRRPKLRRQQHVLGDKDDKRSPAAEEEGHIEEFYGQLWLIPSCLNH